MINLLLLGSILLACPRPLVTDQGYTIEESQDKGKVTFKSGKVVYYDIKPGYWTEIDHVKEEVTQTSFDDIFGFIEEPDWKEPLKEPEQPWIS